MDTNEKRDRCHSAATVEREGRGTLCVVYSRSVDECNDCSFSTIGRPMFLIVHGIDPATEET